ncbi:heat shock protein DnaJ domain protein [[Leptolyngbya] sp. PCC 7376]|uniref:CPP1-like family protein n=1 Tax=[Leptolyngbya] sp. PCC 7376 TaxID=111781 RepID=UPI00029F3169|nr:CPP1-like family protein [[Leptolyngbya] sp. PCC 7376]AFY37363.1 heat shock protein DnaJ domain protein [[Leptolyngbya] sp. PCC 7376]
MSEQNPYKTLGLAESASFEEIQAAKQKLSKQHQEDTIVVEQLEAAYDAIIMDRLRQRQEGKLEVPEQIRFAESQKKVLERPKGIDTSSLPSWVSDLRDTPEPQELNLALGINAAIAIGSLLLDASLASTILTVLLVVNVYLLYRKENRFGRSLLIGIVSLVAGVAIGSGVNAIIGSQGVNASITPEQIVLFSCCLTNGLSTSFLR